jgi:hypothetical protein
VAQNAINIARTLLQRLTTVDNTPPFLPAVRKRSFEGQAPYLQPITAHVNNVAKSTAVSCTISHVAVCATCIESSNMTHIWFFMQKFSGEMWV